MRRFASSVFLAVLLAGGVAAAQSSAGAWKPGHSGIGFAAPAGKQWVQMVSPAQVEIAGVTGVVPLRFAVQNGLHINSHHPHSRYLISTSLTLHPPAGIEIEKMKYPAGADMQSPFDSKEIISAYSGEFAVLVHLRVAAGSYTVPGRLRYQSCDDRTCNPAQELPITLEIAAH